MRIAPLSIDIARPVHEVFEFTTDLERMARIAPQMGKMVLDGPMREGARMLEARRVLGRPAHAEWIVARYEPDRAVAYRMRFGPLRGEFAYLVEPLGPSSTRVVQEMDVGLWGPLAVFDGMLAREVRGEEARELARMKTLLESGS